MRKYKEIFDKYNITPTRYKMQGKVVIVDTENESFVIKKRNRYQNNKIYNYLDSRNFNYYPKHLNTDFDDYELFEYVDDIDIPKEQKMLDLIDLVSLLHSKTTHYKEVDLDDFKELYEDINNNIMYLKSYYNDLITLIETEIFMSPSNYLLARNISKIFKALNFCKIELDNWYELVKDKTKKRLVVLHNNLDLSHFLRNSKSYLINWEKAKIDNPIFDIYKLYKRSAIDFEFGELFKRYEKNFPLLESERKLFFVLISLPDKIEFGDNEYKNTLITNKMLDYLYKTDIFISPYYSKEGK